MQVAAERRLRVIDHHRPSTYFRLAADADQASHLAAMQRIGRVIRREPVLLAAELEAPFCYAVRAPAYHGTKVRAARLRAPPQRAVSGVVRGPSSTTVAMD